MRAIVWKGLAGASECEAKIETMEGTEALVWVPHRSGHDLSGVVVRVGDDVCSIEVGDLVTLLFSAGDLCCSSSLWGMTEFLDELEVGHLVRVPLAELNLIVETG